MTADPHALVFGRPRRRHNRQLPPGWRPGNPWPRVEALALGNPSEDLDAWDNLFWSNVCPEAISGCWLWMGTIRGSDPGHGYGTIGLNGRATAAHRVAFIATRCVEIGPKQYVCHRCDVPACVNPDHLFLGTNADNMLDMYKKGRSKSPYVRGERHRNAILTEKDVRAIRALRETGKTLTQIVAELGLTSGAVHGVIYSGGWSHIK